MGRFIEWLKEEWHALSGIFRKPLWCLGGEQFVGGMVCRGRTVCRGWGGIRGEAGRQARFN